MDHIVKDAKEKPGVGRYDTVKKHKIFGNYTTKEPIGAFTDDAKWRGMSTPSHYNSVDTNIYKDRIPFTKFYKTIKENDSNTRGMKIVKNNSPSPVHYNADVSYLKASHSPKVIKWSVPKAPKLMFTDKMIKLSKKVPGVGQYSPEKTQDCGIMTIGARGKQGYYQKW